MFSPCCTDGGAIDNAAITITSEPILPSAGADEGLSIKAHELPTPAAALDFQPAVLGSPNRPPKKRLYNARIERGGGLLGLDLSPHDGMTLLVGKVKPGVVQQWSAARPAGAPEVRRGDRILAVNGVSGDSEEILETMRASASLDITFSRLLEFHVCIERELDESLGLKFIADATGGVCAGEVVEQGLIDRVNETSAADVEVRPGDRVVRMNGRALELKEFQETVDSLTKMDIVFRRPLADEEGC